jgi:cation diffusion facilitator CzcD-associated flavoprotein CzcO
MGSYEEARPDYDVLVIGAGLSGCYASYRMKKLNLTVKVLEAGTSVGGTWYWSQSSGVQTMMCALILILYRSLSWLSFRL